LSDRKYRQRGYQDSREEKPRPNAGEKPAKKDDTFGPRPVQMPGTRMVSRCSQCGALLQGVSNLDSKCPKCGFELHSCKQCTYFDPSSRFECMQPVPERVARKDARNECTFYEIRVTREKETSTGSPTRPNDARQAFDNLFKK
jgi:phage FluMu protein Com